jgi:hypothetical protein
MLFRESHISCNFSGPYNSGYEEFCLLGHNAVKFMKFQWTTWQYTPEERTLQSLFTLRIIQKHISGQFRNL